MAPHPGSRKKVVRWRPCLCNCGLYENSHLIRSKKAWRSHQLYAARLLAGARDAEPKNSQLAHVTGRESTDSDLDIGSSIATNPYGGAEYESFCDDDISLDNKYSSGNPGTTTGSSSERSRRDSHTTTGSRNSGTGSIQAPAHCNDSERTLSTLLARGYSSDLNTDNLAEKRQGDMSASQQMSQEEHLFLEEVENLIGNPDDWSSSDDAASVMADPFEVGLMKTGLIDEDVLEDDDNQALVDLEEVVAGLGFRGAGNGDELGSFLYENETGKP